MYGFLDQYTGRMIVCEIEDGEHVDTTIDFNGKSYDITLAFSIVSTGSYLDLGYGSKLLPAQMIFTLTCPKDYDGAAFFVSGCSSDDFDVYVANPIGHCDTFDNSGYAFYCWNTKEDGTGESYGDKASVILTDDLVLYAQWAVEISDYQGLQAFAERGVPLYAITIQNEPKSSDFPNNCRQ